jgi:hypothetical protein
MRFRVQLALQCRSDARLADAGLAGEQYDLVVTSLGALPASRQQVEILVATDQRVNLDPCSASNRLLTPLGRSTCQTGIGSAKPFSATAIAVLEEIAEQPAGDRGDDDRVRFSQGLQPGGKVGVT